MTGILKSYRGIGQVQHHLIGIFISLEVSAWVNQGNDCVPFQIDLFLKNINISKSTSVNTQHSSLWDTLKIMLITKHMNE